MVTRNIHTQSERLNRRSFLGLAAATACTGVATSSEQVEGAILEIIRIGPRERPRSDIETWNVGLITASRRDLTVAENELRNGGLVADICLHGFGYMHMRGRYVENYATVSARTVDEHAFLVIGNNDDSGNLKGFLRKHGRRYDQDSVIHKNYYRNARLHALKDLPGLGMSDGEIKDIGRFHPNRVGAYHTLMTRLGACALPGALEDLWSSLGGVDWVGGRWEDIGLWTRRSFFSRTERRVVFEASAGGIA